MATVRVQKDDFDPAAEAEALARGRTDVGAVVNFIGYCRDEGGGIAALLYGIMFVIYLLYSPSAITLAGITDLLNNTIVLALAGPQARLEFAGKRGGKPSATQAEE